jgi:hypothetical protein
MIIVSFFRNKPIKIALILILSLGCISVSGQNSSQAGVIQGKVYDASTGNPIPNALVKVWYFSDFNNPLSITTDRSGYFRFKENFSDQSNVFLMLTVDGFETFYKSIYTKYKGEDLRINLNRPKSNELLVETLFRGNQIYGISDGMFYKVNGTVNSKDNFFFPDLRNRSEVVVEMMNAMQVDGSIAQNDEEVFHKCKKVWLFLRQKTKNVMPVNGTYDPEIKPAVEFLFPNTITGKAVKAWPSIYEYAMCLQKFGFIPLMNCTSHALATAAFMHLAGIPSDNIAVERMTSTFSWRQEHWTVIVKMYGIWYWFDPQWSQFRFPSFSNIQSIPEVTTKNCYNTPFEIVTLPGSTISKVPYCGPNGKVE